MSVIIVLLAGLAAVSAVPAFPQRIVGGSLTTIDQYPTIAALLYSPDGNVFRQDCGGTIINSRSILTAAHCVNRDSSARWRFRVGSSYANSGGTVYNSNSIIVHPSYDALTLDSDVAIMSTNTTINFINVIQPASIAGSNYNLGDNQVVWAAGWGATSSGGPPSEQLRHVQIWTVNQNICRQLYAELRQTITGNMLCSGWIDVGGYDQCQGDSGGPLYHNGVVVGVSSWGKGCGMARYPGVNVRVSNFASWIQATA